MKKILPIIILSCFISFTLLAQEMPEEAIKDDGKKDNKLKEKVMTEPGFEMKKYWFVMLTKGKNRSHDSASAAKIQQGHMENITRLYEMGKIHVAGPFGDDGNWRGIFIMDCKDQKEAEELLQTDPAIKAGRLAFEIHPWWTAKNSVFK
ncbi:MAG: YciI family protein [Chitinophagaceae bacterium]